MRWDDITNALEPRPLPPRQVGDNPPTHWAPERRPPLRVRVRLAWQTDGEEYVETIASAYDVRDGGVCVAISDSRHSGSAVWLPARDVQALGPADEEPGNGQM